MKFITLDLAEKMVKSIASKVALKSHKHSNNDITDLDASKLTGKISADQLPNDLDISNTTASFTSIDTEDKDASAWTNVAVLTSGEKHASLFAKVSQMFKNVRYLYKMLGTTDISSIGCGTVTGAIVNINALLNSVQCGRCDLVSNGSSFIEVDVVLKSPYIDDSYVVVISPIQDVNPYFNRADFYVKKIDNTHFHVCVYRENEDIANHAVLRVGWIAYHITQ